MKIPEDKFVILCCTMRSGSTTLQRMLNTIPNSNICGENSNALESLCHFIRRIEKTNKQLSHWKDNKGRCCKDPTNYEELVRNRIKPAWYNSYEHKEILNLTKELIIKMFKNSESTSLWGFKEIRFGGKDPMWYIEELKKIFPQLKVVINTRKDFQAQVKSVHWKNRPNAADQIREESRILNKFYEENKYYAHRFYFEDIFDLKKVNNLFKFLGEEDHFNEEKISNVLENNWE